MLFASTPVRCSLQKLYQSWSAALACSAQLYAVRKIRGKEQVGSSSPGSLLLPQYAAPSQHQNCFHHALLMEMTL